MKWNHLTDDQVRHIQTRYIGQKAIVSYKEAYAGHAAGLDHNGMAAYIKENFPETRIVTLSADHIGFFKTEYITLLLRPLETMTDAHALEVCQIICGHQYKNPDLLSVKWVPTAKVNDFILEIGFKASDGWNDNFFLIHIATWGAINLYHQHKDGGTEMGNCSRSVFVYQFLERIGYSLPFYIDQEHPDNGRTPIEMHLALPLFDVAILEEETTEVQQ
jgi:hypothetical protein